MTPISRPPRPNAVGWVLTAAEGPWRGGGAEVQVLGPGPERWTDDFEQWPPSRRFHLAYLAVLIGQDGWNAFNFL